MFSGLKLKKGKTVKRSWGEDKMETVELKHHEFEKLPQEETPEKGSTCIMSEPIEDEEKEKKKKKKKVRPTLFPWELGTNTEK